MVRFGDFMFQIPHAPTLQCLTKFGQNASSHHHLNA